ncbi:ABC transporter permease [Phytoactinopolyspora mesophila]|uniref:Transport permease protein n=1 Tax=Phytoactinopolyspora mesophila TaxID=2650750 RepID=A0A7K3M4M0_9ACTN|nr:ABC transporter permease [Phytoactinopolyspora mesophila]NDL58259.1 ABC transporter permease [Phytoactinopolyspora mesophila]
MSSIVIPRTRPARLRAALSDSKTMTRRNLVYWSRSPEEIIGGLAFPLVSVLLFGYVFGSAMTVPGDADYREYLLPGLFGMTMVFGLVTTIGAVVTDRDRGVTDRFMAMPIASSAILIGRSGSDTIRASADLVVLIGCGYLVGWRSHGTVWETLAAVGLLLLLRFALIWVGIYIGLVLRSPDSATVLYPLILPFAMVANTFVPPAMMPGWLGTVAEANPMSSTVAATRELFGNPAVPGESWIAQHPLPLAILWPLVLLAVFFPLAVHRYRRARH